MVNHVIFGGSDGRLGRDCEFKYGIAKYLPKDWNVSIVSRVKEAEKYIKDKQKVNFEYIFDDGIFRKSLKKKEIEEAERWLGYSLRFIKHCSRGIKDITNKKIEEKNFELMAKLIIYWRNYFEKNKTELFTTTLVSDVPASIPLLVAKRMGIKIINLIPGKITNSHILSDGDYKLLEWNSDSYKKSEVDGFYKKLQEEYLRKKEITYPHLAEDVSRFYSPVRSFWLFGRLLWFINFRRKKKHELYLEDTKWIIGNYIKSVIRRKIIPYLYKPIKKMENFFFFPLHYTLDAQILYREPFLDQYYLIEQISYCIPHNCFLYVKPHPHWGGSDLEYGKLRKLLNFSNIKLIHHKINPFYLIKNALATLTINSTTGYEAIILNKPLITFGHEDYSKDGVSIVIRDLNDLPHIISRVVEDPNYGIDIDKRKEFIYKVFKNTIKLEGKIGRDYWHYTENDYRNIASAFVRAFEKVK